MPKTKINVLTVTLKVDIPVDPGSLRSVQDAATSAERLREVGNKIGRATMETRLNRVPAPESEPEPPPEAAERETVAAPPDDLDIPDNLRRVPKPAATEPA